MAPDELVRYYDYPRESIHVVVRDLRGKPECTHKLVEFGLSLPPELNDEFTRQARREAAVESHSRRARDRSLEYTVRFDYYQPASTGKHPFVVLSTILGGNNAFVDDFARYFAAHGYCAAVVHRRAARLGPHDGLDRIEKSLRKEVIRVRQVIDWAETQPEVDASRIASLGISFGAIINTMVAGAEPRIRYHIFALGGANLPDILMSTAEPRLRYQLARVANARGWDHKRTHEELGRALKSDPLNSVPLLDRDHVLMIVAHLDTVVGTRYENLLWRELGKPRRIVVPLGHAPAALAMPLIKGKALRFLDEKFGMPQPEAVEVNHDAYGSKRY